MKQELIYRKNVHLQGGAVSASRTLRTSELFRLFQEAGAEHNDVLGCGQPFLLSRNKNWVVAMYRAEIDRLPAFGEDIVVETWPGAVNRLLCPRYYAVRSVKNGNADAESAPLIRCSSVWVIEDLEKRAAVNPLAEKLIPDAVDWTENRMNVSFPKTSVTVRKGIVSEQSAFTVPYHFIDLNGHMNNTRYFDLAEDILHAEYPKREFRLSFAEIEYREELHFGDAVTVLRGEGPDNTFYFQGDSEHPKFRLRLSFQSERKGEEQ